MAKYKVGDIVTVRHDLTINVSYDSYFAVDDMETLRGKIVKIIEVVNGTTNDVYRIENSDWLWTNSMFEEEKYDFPSKEILMDFLNG